MRVMVMVRATRSSEAGAMPSAEMLTAMSRFNEELVSAGVMLSGDGLQPSSKGKRVRFAGGEPTVVDAPFGDPNELIAGFWMWRVQSMEEALEWVKRCPNPMPGEVGEIEIRPVVEDEDFGEALTPEVREREVRMRAEMQRLNET